MSEKITIELDKKQAEQMIYDIADVLCWWQGFQAGCQMGEDYNNYHSICSHGIEAIRRLNIKLKDEVRPCTN